VNPAKVILEPAFSGYFVLINLQDFVHTFFILSKNLFFGDSMRTPVRLLVR